MAKQHFVKKARKDIWKKGEGEQPDTILIAKGESYYWLKFRYQVKRVSKQGILVIKTQSNITGEEYNSIQETIKSEAFKGGIEDLSKPFVIVVPERSISDVKYFRR